MKEGSHHKTLYFAILLILAGLVFLAYQFDVLSDRASYIIISWPMLIIAIGLINLIQRQSRGFGVILLIVGGFFLLPRLDIGIDRGEIWRFWPVLLIIFGFFIIFKVALRRRGHGDDQSFDGDSIDDVNVFGGSEKPIVSQNFRGGNLTCIFGGSELDMRQTRLSQGTNVIDVLFLFGGSGFKVPSDWKVNTNVTAIFGGFSDKRKTPNIEITDPTKTLEIRGTVIFGGGEIKN